MARRGRAGRSPELLPGAAEQVGPAERQGPARVVQRLAAAAVLQLVAALALAPA